MICSICHKPLAPGAQFCSACGSAVNGAAYQQEQRRLTRPRGDRKIAGVCAGIAQYYGWDVATVRLAVFLATFFLGLPLAVYVVLWIVMPESPNFVPMVPPGPPAS